MGVLLLKVIELIYQFDHYFPEVPSIHILTLLVCLHHCWSIRTLYISFYLSINGILRLDLIIIL